MAVSQVVAAGSAYAFSKTTSLAPISRSVDYAYNNLWPNAMLDAPESQRLFVHGLLTYHGAQVASNVHGFKLPDIWSYQTGIRWEQGKLICTSVAPPIWEDPRGAAVAELYYKPDLGQLEELVLRGNIDDQLANHFYRRHGLVEVGLKNGIQSLYFDIPPVPTLVSMAVVGALNPFLVEANDLLAEMPAQYLWWAHANGTGPVNIHVDGPNGEPIDIDFAQALWAAHWAYPSYQQALLMQKRLRPGGPGEGAAHDPSGIVVTSADVAGLARVNGISPRWRDALQAISYRPISVRFLRTQIVFGGATAAEVEGILQDQGYSPAVTPSMAMALAKQARQVVVRQAHSAASGWIVQAWEAGVITVDQVQQYWRGLDLTDEQIRIATSDMTLRDQTRRVRRVIGAIKSQFMHGKLTEQQAKDQMNLLGVNMDRQSTLVNDWLTERTGDVIELQVAKLVSLAKSGIIQQQYLLQRLKNLNVDNDDIQIIMTDVAVAIAEAQAKKLAALEKEVAKELLAKQKEAARLVKELEAEHLREERQQEAAVKAAASLHKQAQAALAKHGSPTQLKKWLCQGTIGQDEVYSRLEFIGWPDIDIQRFLEETTNPCKATGGAAP